MAEGIEVRHRKGCRYKTERCACKPTYRAGVYSHRDKKKIYESFPSMAAAKTWRADALVKLGKGQLRPKSPTTVREAAEALIAGMADGSIRAPKGTSYKPSYQRNVRGELRSRTLPRFGDYRLADLRRNDVQDWIDELVAAGAGAATIQMAIVPLRVIYRRAIQRGDVAVNPTKLLEIPSRTGRRDRIADPAEAAALIAALPTELDRALWATAFYAGLRLGELQALRWDDVDLRAKEIRVRHGWDERAKELLEPKSRAGKRVVPIIATLHERLLDLRLELAKAGNDHGYVFGRRAAPRAGRPRTSTELASIPHPDTPFIAQTAYRAARRAWKAAGLAPIGLHECRHTCASTMIHAMAVSGIVNVKALTEIMGHETVAMTYDRYGHLLPGSQQQIAKATEGYIREHMEEARRLASLDE